VSAIIADSRRFIVVVLVGAQAFLHGFDAIRIDARENAPGALNQA